MAAGARRDHPAGSVRHVLVLTGGEPVVPPLPRRLPDADMIIAADSGLAVAGVLGVEVDVVVGDLDSVQPSALHAARMGGALIERHPVDKDRTDLEIAVDAARDAGAETLTVIGGSGGRFDHLLAMPLLLASDAYADMRITAVSGNALITVVRGSRVLTGEPGELVGLLAVHGDARGVTTRGLRFRLDHDVLEAGSSRGVSNVFDDESAEIDVASGVVLAIQPEARAPDPTTTRDPLTT